MKNKFSLSVSKKFWSSQEEYPAYGDIIKKRRLYESQYLSKYIWENKNLKTITDIGCGNGSTVTILQELTDIKEYHCYDISPKLVSTINTGAKRGAKVSASVLDLTSPTFSFPESDITLSLGVFMCVDDLGLSKLLQKVSSPVLITRDPCSIGHREEVNTFSEKLGDNYSGVYRTPEEYVNLFKKSGFQRVNYHRAFPDDIESEFGTKQYFFLCER